MDCTILCDIEEFEAKALWPESKGAIPTPSSRALQVAETAVRGLFYSTEDPQKRLNPSEDNIAKVMVHDVINRIELPRKHKAALSQNEYNLGDASKAKMDAALYLRENLPTDGRPDWTHLRAFIVFKKGGTRLDPWDDENDQPESWAESRAEVRGRLIWYAHMSFLYQHRTDLYSLFINGSEFRAIRWDRSGLIVSKATDYAEDPSRLFRFLWAFASLSDAEQGLDPSATLLSSIMPEWKVMDSWSEPNDALDMPFMDRDDVSRFFAQPAPAPKGPAARTRRQETKRSAKPVFKFVRDQFRKSLDPESGWPRYKLQVGETKREFLVGKPVFQSTSVFGRGTRGYIALDCATGSFVFLKDSWRPFYEGVEREGDYLTAMASDGSVEMVIPTVVEHGDVLNQTTFSAKFNIDSADVEGPEKEPLASSGNASFSSRSAAPVTMLGKKRPYEEEDAAPDEGQPRMASPPDARYLIHYRIAVEEVCLTLDAFQYGLQLVKIIEDCIITHRDAYEHFGLLHRDVSVGNILILPRILDIDGRKEVLWHGLLTDWELAKYVPKDSSDPQRGRQPERTGTWQFMSVAYVRNPERPVIIADELESFFHVLLYQSVRYLRSSLGTWVTSFITNYFDAFQQNGTGTQICHPYKVAAVETGEVKHSSSGVVIFNNLNGPSPMNGLFREWLSLFQARYAVLKLEPKPSIPADEQPEDLLIGIVRGRNWALKRTQFEPRPPKEPNATASPETQAFLKTMNQAEDQLNNHAATLNIFSKFREGTDDATAPPWSMQDKLGDQLSSSYDPRYQVINLRRSAVSAMASNQRASSSKKVKVDPNSRPSNASAARPLPMDAPQPPDASAATAQPGPNDTRRVTEYSSKVTLRGRDLPVPKRKARARK